MRHSSLLPKLAAFAFALLLSVVMQEPAAAAAPGEARHAELPSQVSRFPIGDKVYQQHCAACHDTGIGRAPQRAVLDNMPPEAIYRALTTGLMQPQGSALTEEQKVQVSQHLADAAMGLGAAADEKAMCTAEHRAFDQSKPPAFTGWGLDHAGTHSVSTGQAGINRENVGRLKLKWAFGFPGATQVRSQPALGAGAIFVGSHNGSVYALDRETGCIRWKQDVGAEVRSGIVLGPWEAGDKDAQPLIYFGDLVGNAYALKAFTGELVWKAEADPHPGAIITGAPVLYRDTVYFPVASIEESSATNPAYPCCNFRGSVLALDAASGAEKWRRWTIDEQAVRQEGGLLGPSGAPVWAGMALDTTRNRLYIATGDNYSVPATRLSDAIVALDLDSGAVAWSYQATEGDAWTVGCMLKKPENCPEDEGPDFDFGAGVVLAKAGGGKDYVMAGQKAGFAYAIDADTGKLAWKQRVGRGGLAGGVVFGIAAAGGRLIVPISDLAVGETYDIPAKPGMNALDIATGKLLWHAPSPSVCNGKRFCTPGYSGAISATPELVFAGSDDGHLRIFDAATGEVLWDMDMDRPFEAVGGLEAHGGATSGGAAPVADGGQLIVSSGYGYVSKLPGNVLAVFEPD